MTEPTPLTPLVEVGAEPFGDPLDLGHRLLCRFVGRAPADAVADGRRAVAAGDAATLSRVLLQLVLGEALPLLPDEVVALRGLLEHEQSEEADFVPFPVDELPPPRLAMQTGAGTDDAVARSLVALAEDDPRVIGVWRAEAVSAWGSPWPRPCDYVVVETDGNDLLGLDLRVHRTSVEAGAEDVVHLAVVGPDGPTTLETAAAQTEGRLLWSRHACEEIRLAELRLGGNGVDGQEPLPPLPDDVDVDALVRYLTGAEVVLRADGLGDDVITGVPDSVPVDLRSDGAWVWSDAAVHYLTEHGIAPDPGLVAHVRDVGVAEPSRLDGVTYHHVMQLLTRDQT